MRLRLRGWLNVDKMSADWGPKTEPIYANLHKG